MSAYFKCVYIVTVMLITGDVLNGILFKHTFKHPWPLRVSFAFGLGSGAMALLVFYAAWLGCSITFANIVFITLAFPALFTFALITRGKALRPAASPGPQGPHVTSVEVLLWAFIAAAAIMIVLRALVLPVHLADDMAQWGLKASIIFYESSIYARDFFDPLSLVYHVRYPFLLPVLQAALCTASQSRDSLLAGALFPSFFIALLLYLYAAQKSFASGLHAVAFTAMAAAMPVFLRDGHGNPSSGYADVALTFYYCIAALNLAVWLERRGQAQLVAASIFMCFAVFTKQEGLVLWAIALCAGLIFITVMDRGWTKHTASLLLFFGILPFFVLLPWFLFQRGLSSPAWEQEITLSQLSLSHMRTQLHRLPYIMHSLADILVTPRHHNLLWLLLGTCVLLWGKNSLNTPLLFLLTLIACTFCALGLAAWLFAFDWWPGMVYDFPRLSMVTIPPAIYLVSRLCFQNFGRFRDR